MLHKNQNEVIKGISLKQLQKSTQFHKLYDMEKLAYLYLLEEFAERLDESLVQDLERNYLLVSIHIMAKSFRCNPYTCCKLFSTLEKQGFVILLHGNPNGTPCDFLIGDKVIVSLNVNLQE